VTIWPRKHKRKTPSQAFTRSKQIYRFGRSLEYCGTVHSRLLPRKCLNLSLFITRKQTRIDWKCIAFFICLSKEVSGGSVVRAFAPWAGGRGFDHRPRHTKAVIKMVPYASLLGAQHIRTGLASLFSQTSFKKKKRWIPSGMSGREWLI